MGTILVVCCDVLRELKHDGARTWGSTMLAGWHRHHRARPRVTMMDITMEVLASRTRRRSLGSRAYDVGKVTRKVTVPVGRSDTAMVLLVS